MAVLTPTYPTALDTATTLGEVEDAVSSTIGAGGVDAVATTVPITSTTGWPNTGMVWCGTEGISYTGKTSTSITGCVRGFRGTASTHAAGDAVYADIISSAHHEALRDAVIALQTELGPRSTRRFNVRNYGAVGDDSTNDKQAFLDAGAAALATSMGGVVYVPAGKYKIDGNLNFTITADKDLAFIGDGARLSVLRFTGTTTGGIYVNCTTTTDYARPTVEVANLSLETSKINSGIAFRLDYTDGDSINNTYNIHDIEINGDYTRASDTGSDFGYWTTGIQCLNARNGRISNCVIHGEQAEGITPGSDRGIDLLGTCIQTDILSNSINEWLMGIQVGGDAEGLYIIDNDIIGGNSGIKFDPTTAGEPQVTILSNGISVTDICIELSEVLGGYITNNYMYANHVGYSSGWPNWTGIKLTAANKWMNISGNVLCRNPQSGTGITTVGINVVDCDGVNINDNFIFAFDVAVPLTTGILLGASALHARVRNNRMFNVTTPISDSGPSTQIETFNDTTVVHESPGDYKFHVWGNTSASVVLKDKNATANLKTFELASANDFMELRSLNDDGTTRAQALRMSGSGGLNLAHTSPNSALVMLPAGVAGASGAALKFQSGSVLTTAEAGAAEYDGAKRYWTNNTTSGREMDRTEQYYRLSADSSALSATLVDYFPASSSFPYVASGEYEILFDLTFLKTTAGTTTWTILFSAAPTYADFFMLKTPIAGAMTTGAPESMILTGTTATTVVLGPTGSLTTAVNHHAQFKLYFVANTAGNVRIRVTQSAGTLTPRRGSRYFVQRLPAANVGTFV